MPRHKPPSRIRYEESHPTISFRLHKDLKSRLEKVLEGKSFATFVKEGLGEREREKASLQDEYKKGYSEGYKKGYDQASSIFGVYTHCVICGGKMLVSREDVKEDIDKYLRGRDVCHKSCL